MVSPVVQRIAREFKGRLLTVKVNTDLKPQVAQRYQITALPTIVMFWQGEPIMRLTGAHPYESLRSQVEGHLPAA